jgi:very-short-patch-repair endonuclease
MTRPARPTSQWWLTPPAWQVSYLADVDPELLSIALDPLPPTAPAVTQFRPGAGRPLSDQVALLLSELDRAAIALFPSWLPGADQLDVPQPVSIAAVRGLAAELAARTRNFGPFLADVAERGFRRRGDAPRTKFPDEVRAAGYSRIIASAYARSTTAVLVHLPEGLSSADERGLTAAAEWLAHNGRFTVWLAGAPLRTVDRIRSCRVSLPTELAQLTAIAVKNPHPPQEAPRVFSIPPISGSPRQDSPAELALEGALKGHEWASGRRWNYTYEWHVLAKPYRLDLFWADERLVVEVDGRDHRGPLKFADDRRRDVQLQLLGHDVLRFTNEQVLSDVQAVVSKIEKSLTQRRAYKEMRHNVRP